MRILFIVPYPKNCAPSQRLKFEQYYTIFQENGIELKHSPFYSESMWKVLYRKGYICNKIIHVILGYFRRIRDLFNIRSYDIVYVHLWVTPIGLPIFEWFFRITSKSLVYDIDDLIFLSVPTKGVNSFFTILKGKSKPIFLMGRADHVITCTPFLDSFVKRYNHCTTDISSTIDTDAYVPKTEYARSNNLTFTLGWSGSHSTSKYLYLLTPVFKKLKELGYDFKIKVMGDPNFYIEGISVEAFPWDEVYEVDVIRGFDIGLYPLPDEKWIYGKSGLKALQYMGLGVPTIATALGTNFRIIEHGINGYLVNEHDEWLYWILELMKSSDLRASIGNSARENVVKNFSLHSNAKKYLDVFHQLSPVNS